MKKNKMMRLASALLVLVLLTTCAISGTFAKYVTTQTGSDNARVAKFGVVITANGSAFADEYATDDENVVATIAKSVVNAGSVDEKNLVAPGTAGEMVAMTLSGTPEVAVEVKYEATLTLTGWEDAEGNFYCPIVFTVNGVEIKQDATNDTAEKLQAAVVAAINAYTANYGPNQNLATEATVGTPDVSWSWPFSTGAENDVKDTHLGDAAAGIIDDAEAATIVLQVVTTVTQID